MLNDIKQLKRRGLFMNKKSTFKQADLDIRNIFVSSDLRQKQTELNKRRFFENVSQKDWNSWHWQMQNRIETVDDLKKYIELTPEEEMGIRKCLNTL